MNIVYLVEWDFSTDSGVKRKVMEHAEIWESQGAKVCVIIVSPNYCRCKIKNCYSFTSFLKYLPDSFIKTYGNKLLSTFKVINILKKLDPDVVYTRQAVWHPLLSYVFSKFPTVLELNTDDVNEIKLESKMKQFIYLLGRNKLLHLCAAFVSVSNEIASIYKCYNKKTVTIANGFRLKEDFLFRKKGKIKKENIRVQLVFCGTSNQGWHGTDKIVRLAHYFPQWDFHIIGEKFSDVPSNIISYGFLPKTEVYEIYANMDVAISTLALHRKKMNEASPLKSREYLAFGFPIIAGYLDTDLDGKDFVLNIGNYEENIEDNLDLIEQFVEKWRGLVVDKSEIVDIDSYKKEYTRLDFFEYVLSDKN